LWLKHLGPFIIYDSVVQRILGTPKGDYHAYVKAWEKRYSEQEGAIERACKHAAGANYLWLCEASVLDEKAKLVLREAWFRRRVLDLLIWRRGL